MYQQEIATSRVADRIRVAAARRWGTYALLAAFFGLLPAIVHLVRHHGHPAAVGVEAWAYVLILASGLQAAYAVLVLQVPDWSSVWVTALVSLCLASGYAMFAGVSLLAREQSRIIQGLGLVQHVGGHRIAGWCLVMLTMTGLLAYMGGQMSVRWQRKQAGQRGSIL